ncbi:chitin deacetylase 7-like [Haliotis cracherodii]|uniref:chitin deacetylase 7-like n=1 Tax=Haliotis cracherodii TaxID=6455 RepID=UPI0039EA040C
MKAEVVFVVAVFLQVAIETAISVENRCTATNCKLPDCRCPGHNIPGGFKPEQIPQMVLITFDDAVNWENWDYYKRLFPPDRSRLNPNGCPVASTLFVSNNFTDYCMLKKLHARGLEIADHSVSHRVPHSWWGAASDEELRKEIVEQKKNLADLAQIPVEDIRGWRSPFLQPTGDTMFNILYENNFTYDATMTYPFPRNVYSPVMWPFTLDYSYTLVCNISPCPKNQYPGFWILPVVVMMDYREHLPCAYVDFCKNAPRNQDEAFQLLWKNFLRNYRTNRAPMYVNLHSVWLQTKFNLDAMDEFIERLTSMDDVYVTTVSKAIEWMRNPTPLTEIQSFEPWQCVKKPNLEDDAFCSFTFKPITTLAPGQKTTDHQHVHGEEEKDKNRNSNTIGRNKPNDRLGKMDLPPPSDAHSNHKKHRPWFLKNSGSEVNLCAKLVFTMLLLSLVMFIRV